MFGLSPAYLVHCSLQVERSAREKGTRLGDVSLALVSKEAVHCQEVSSLYSGNKDLGMKVGQDSELSHQKKVLIKKKKES